MQKAKYTPEFKEEAVRQVIEFFERTAEMQYSSASIKVAT